MSPVRRILATSGRGLMLAIAMNAHAQTDEDPYLWLEEVEGARAMQWVHEQNAISQPQLEGKPGFKALQDRLVRVLTSRERIPMVSKRGKWLYNFWQDGDHPRGILRRTTLAEYRNSAPAWETASVVAMKVWGTVTTTSPALTPAAIKANRTASVPLARPTHSTAWQ